MLTPEYLDTLPDTLVSLWQRVEDDILRDIARRIGKMDTVTETAAWQLWRLEQTRALRTDIVRLLAKYSGKSDTEIRRLLQEAGTRTLASDDALYQAMGLDPPNVNTSPALLNLLNAGYRQTRGTWQNFTRTTANTVTRQFENALDRAWLQVSSGAFDYKTAIKRAVDGLSQDMKYITYPTGHRDTLEVAVRRAVLTGVNQTACKLQIARADEMGCEFVEVSAHSGARSDGSRGPRDHAWWQGKVYHRGSAVEYNGERYESFEDATGYGTGEGLCGWNCRHNFHPFWPGISVPNYTPERLAELNARNIGYNGKMYTRYEIDQQQRALERRVRAAKRKYLAESAADVDTAQAAVQLSYARHKLKAFVQATGGRADSARESVSGFGRSQASTTSWASRKLGILNGLIDSINWVIEKVNGISFTNPFTGNTVGFNFPSIGKIPYLAQGAVIPPNREFMAVLGDQSSGTNIEAPLETIKQALSEVMTQQGGGDINIKFTGDLAQLARVLQPVIEREQHRRGTRLVKGVV